MQNLYKKIINMYQGWCWYKQITKKSDDFSIKIGLFLLKSLKRGEWERNRAYKTWKKLCFMWYMFTLRVLKIHINRNVHKIMSWCACKIYPQNPNDDVCHGATLFHILIVWPRSNEPQWAHTHVVLHIKKISIFLDF